MFSKLVALFLIVCVYSAAAITYEEAFKGCKGKFNLQSDAPLDYFMEKGEFEPNSVHLKCFFDCLATDLGLKTADGNINTEALKQLAQGHTHCQEMALFASDSVLQACGQPSSSTEECGKVFGFIQCAIKLKNSAPKS